MKVGKPYTFRCSELMCEEMERIMKERCVDRTSVIRLALYLLGEYMRREEVQQADLAGLIELMEREAPADYPRFARFSGARAAE